MPYQLIVLTIPSLIYAAVCRRRGEKWNDVFENLGWRGCRPRYFLWAFGVMIAMGVLAWLAFQVIPSEVFNDPRVSMNQYAGWRFSIGSFFLIVLREAFYVVLGEEIFFRGLLGGWLVRRFGCMIGNTLQALVFLLPHLLLLLVSYSLWPLVVVQGIAGWVLGWLRYRSKSISPGWFVHSVANTSAALAFIT